MKMGYQFPGVLVTDFSVLETDGARIRAVVETRYYPLPTQHVVAVFSHTIAEQLND